MKRSRDLPDVFSPSVSNSIKYFGIARSRSLFPFLLSILILPLGGSVAELDGFIADYLSLNGSEDGVVFVSYLKGARYFTANASPKIYNKLLEFRYE